MTDFIAEFISFMESVDCAPANVGDIIADDKRHYFQIARDKRGVKKGAYRLLIDGDSAVGWVIDYRQGDTHSWSSRSKKDLTAEEKAEWKRKNAERKKANEIEDKRLRDAAATVAKEVWGKADKCEKHQYLDKKGIGSNGAKYLSDYKYSDALTLKDVLIIPAYKSGRISSIQFISGDLKLFLQDGDMNGAYSVIKSGDDLGIIYICEGWATGASIHEATGCAVVVAFNAGNLVAVAKTMRDKYQDSEIIIAADNDQWTLMPESKRPKALKAMKSSEISGDDERWTEWRQKDYTFNTGIIKAKQAAIEIGGCKVVFPPYKGNEPHKPTDWNDFAKDFGYDVLKNQIQVVAITLDRGEVSESPLHPSDDLPPPYIQTLPIEAYESDFSSMERREVGDWRELIVHNSKGVMVANSLKNTILFVENHTAFRGVYVLNEFNHQISVVKCPPWEDDRAFKVHDLSDIDISQTAAALEAYGLSPDTTRIHKAIEVVANINKVHPAKEYFNSLEWDGVERLDKWLNYYLGAEEESADYLEFIGTKWMVAAVKRIYQSGCKFDHILVLEGNQGIGKSTALRELATFNDVPYFKDGLTVSDIRTKDSILQMQGCIIIELAELAGFSKKDDDELKQWITFQFDECRLPYARTNTKFPRQFVLSATTNNYEYLKDATGNRRYWPIKCSGIDITALRKDRQQLWAEAVHLYKSGYSIAPTQDEMDLAKFEQAKRLASDPWEEDILKAISGLGHKATMQQIMIEVGLSIKDRDQKASRRIGYILGKCGYESKPVYSGGVTRRMWVRQDG